MERREGKEKMWREGKGRENENVKRREGKEKM